MENHTLSTRERSESVSWRAHPRRIVRHRYMQGRWVNHPAVEIVDESEAGEATTNANCLNGAIVCREGRVPALSCARHLSGADRQSEVEVSGAARHKLLLLREASQCSD